MLVALLLLVAAAPQGEIRIADDVVLHDPARARDIPLKIYFPAAPGKFPVIVFSHGLGASKEAYGYLGRAWAEQGYVVILPTHAGSDSTVLIPGHRLETLLALKDAAERPQNWSDRPKDVSWILSSFAELEKQVPGLAGKLDAGHIGVGGHSMGAQTSMVLAGGKLTADGKPLSVTDPRVAAFLAMSPQGDGELGWTEHSWDEVRKPVMILTGTQDRGLQGQPSEWRQTAFKHLPPGDKFQAVLDGATHFTFAGVGGATSDSLLRPIEALSTTFWSAYLKGNAAAKQSLRSGKPWTGGGVAFTAK